jgi:protein involved in temperature-dependent protein secretion
MAKAAKRYIKDDTKRIEVLNILIEGGYIKTWAAIFDNIPRSTVAAHLGINNTRMKDLVADPSGLTLERLAELSIYLKVKYSVLSELAYKAMPVAKRAKKRN